MEILYYTLLGALVVWAMRFRYRTLHSEDYFLGMKVTLFAFTSLAIGLTIANQEVARAVTRASFGRDRLLLFALIAYGAFFLFRYLVHRRLEFDLAKLIFLGGGGTFAFALALDLEPVHGIYIASITGFVGIMLLLGALHALLGPVIAALNLALAINYFVQTFQFNYDALFNVLDLIHVETGPLRLALLATSTVLGVMEAANFFGLKGLMDGH